MANKEKIWNLLSWASVKQDQASKLLFSHDFKSDTELFSRSGDLFSPAKIHNEKVQYSFGDETLSLTSLVLEFSLALSNEWSGGQLNILELSLQGSQLILSVSSDRSSLILSHATSNDNEIPLSSSASIKSTEILNFKLEIIQRSKTLLLHLNNQIIFNQFGWNISLLLDYLIIGGGIDKIQKISLSILNDDILVSEDLNSAKIEPPIIKESTLPVDVKTPTNNPNEISKSIKTNKVADKDNENSHEKTLPVFWPFLVLISVVLAFVLYSLWMRNRERISNIFISKKRNALMANAPLLIFHPKDPHK